MENEIFDKRVMAKQKYESAHKNPLFMKQKDKIAHNVHNKRI